MTDSSLRIFCRSRLSYNMETGHLTWTAGRLKGQRAGSAGESGRRKIKIAGKTYKEHRIIFLMVMGRFPKEQIDHIDHNPSNNKWDNLRECSNKQNSMNLPMMKTKKTSRYPRVSIHRRDQNYRVRINKPGGGVYTKYFKSEDDAGSHAREKYIEFGYHPNHGTKIES